MTEINLLGFIFLYGVTSALMAPAWQAIVPQLVDPPDLPPAIALDSVAVNISRAIGPALAGLFIAYFGMAGPFWFNVLANLGVIGALIWWRDREVLQSSLPPERFSGAIRAGIPLRALTIGICARPSFGLRAFFCSPAPTGRFFP